MKPRASHKAHVSRHPAEPKIPRASISPNHSFEDPPADPKLLRDMTDAEIGALVRARNEGKEIEVWSETEFGYYWLPARPNWLPDCAYRVRPEPKPEPKTVTLYGHRYAFWLNSRSLGCTHSITYTLREDGTPDCNIPAKIEELTDAD